MIADAKDVGRKQNHTEETKKAYYKLKPLEISIMQI